MVKSTDRVPPRKRGNTRRSFLSTALAGGAAYVGNFLGVLIAPALRRSVREEVILASSLVLPAAFALLGALVAGAVGFVLAAFTLGIGAAAGRLGFDSLLQRDGPDAVRGRAFAKFETRFQLVWVIGGIIAIIPFAKQMGLFLLAIVPPLWFRVMNPRLADAQRQAG